MLSGPVLHLPFTEPCLLFQNWLDPSKEIKKQIRSEWPVVVANVVGQRVGAPGCAGPSCAVPCSLEKCMQTHEFICSAQQILGEGRALSYK